MKVQISWMTNEENILDNIWLTVHTEVNWHSAASVWWVGGNGWKTKSKDECEIARYLLGLAKESKLWRVMLAHTLMGYSIWKKNPNRSVYLLMEQRDLIYFPCYKNRYSSKVYAWSVDQYQNKANSRAMPS